MSHAFNSRDRDAVILITIELDHCTTTTQWLDVQLANDANTQLQSLVCPCSRVCEISPNRSMLQSAECLTPLGPGRPHCEPQTLFII